MWSETKGVMSWGVILGVGVWGEAWIKLRVWGVR